MSLSEMLSGNLAFCRGVRVDGPASELILPCLRGGECQLKNKQRSLSSSVDPAENPESFSATILGFLCNAMLYYFLS
jgi:hypothetical protein